MQRPRAALFVLMDPPSGEEHDFDDWYATEHIPERMRTPGFLGALRGRVMVGGPRHLAVYWLRSLAVLDQPEYLERRRRPTARSRRIVGEPLGTGTGGALRRFACEEISDTGPAPAGRYLQLETFAAPPGAEQELDRFYEHDRLPEVCAQKRWLRCRRFAVRESFPFEATRVVLHELASPGALGMTGTEQVWRTSTRLGETQWLASATVALYERFQQFAGAA